MALLWIAYLVPHRLRHRQQLLESCAEDRFSAALRVLVVADRQGRSQREGEARAECGPGSEKRSGLLTPSREGPARGQVQGRVLIAVTGGRIVDRPHGTQEKVSADAARRVAQRRAQRAASLARRAAAARRRAALTVALLAISAVAWAVVGVASLTVAFAVVPTVALAGVLVLGRRAVVHGHVADAAWEIARHVPLGGAGDAATPVVGRAHHPSDAHTEVIARVRDAAPTDNPARTGSSSPDALAPDVRPADGTPAGSLPSAALQSESARVAADAILSGAQPEGWSPVPVPPPVYTTKAAAPRREPIPLVLDEPAPAAATSAGTSSDEVPAPADETPADLEAAQGSSSPTLDLDAILARRRNAG